MENQISRRDGYRWKKITKKKNRRAHGRRDDSMETEDDMEDQMVRWTLKTQKMAWTIRWVAV